MRVTQFIEKLQRRLLTEETDASIRADIRDLVIARLQDDSKPLTYCTKYELSRAIGALRRNVVQSTEGFAHPGLRFALLQYQLASIEESDRDGDDFHREDIIEALTREMLLEAALVVR